MKLVLLSGGSGKRLWPLSNDIRSKQFLRLLKDVETGAYESMIQRVYKQLRAAGLIRCTYIATGKDQVDILQNQLEIDLPLIIEPQRRDTFPAIALAGAFLYTEAEVNLDEVICVVPVDHYVEDVFFERIKELESVLLYSEADFALMGVTPSYPATHYGYIIPDKNTELGGNVAFRKVVKFSEKPSENQAAKLINQNALWNCGVVAFKLGHIISMLLDRGLPIVYEDLQSQYTSIPKISFDYGVLEKAAKIAVISYPGMWSDIGTWDALTKKLDQNVIGKGSRLDESSNTHVINELNLPIVAMGVKDLIVAASPDGILVADKKASSEIKKTVENIQNRPMFEEKRWGWYQVLEFVELDSSKQVLVKRIKVKAGKNLSYQLHHHRCEVWTVISGEGEFVLDNRLQHVKAGDVLQIPLGAKHGIKANSDLEFIEVQTGSQLVEEDIIRFYHNWDEVLLNCWQKDGE